MARLFIFAIGGTGARVLKALTLLLASGVKPQAERNYELVPILIDPHKANDDLKRALRLLGLYQKIRAQLPPDPGFFNVPMQTLSQIVASGERVGDGFSYDLSEVSSSRFRDYVNYDRMSEPNRLLMEFLFSGKSVNKRGQPISLLDIDMDIGFVGNPNVGSVVLNQFRESAEFKEFSNNFGPDDRVFIISSIFGGTGAAGFPCILKNIRDVHNNLHATNRGNLAQARIGAVTVLPYFNVESSDTSPIQVSQFIAKTKAALYYYGRNVNPMLNAMYYIGDRPDKPYINDPGDDGQKNDAHFVELSAAMSIIDFLGIADNDLAMEGGQPTSTICKEFGIKHDEVVSGFLNLGNEMQQKIALPLSQFMLFRNYVREQLLKSIGKRTWCNDSPVIGPSFLASGFFMNELSELFQLYDDWIREMGGNRRGFVPFKTNAGPDLLISGILPEKGMFRKKVDYELLDALMSKKSAKASYTSVQEKLMDLFFRGTKELLAEQFAYFKMAGK